MKSILEQALVLHLNKEHDKAEELLHQFVVDRARQIHESLREEDEEELDMTELEEELFTEDDLMYGDEDKEEAVDDLTDDLSGDEMVDLGDAEGEVDADADMDMDAEVEPEMDVEEKLEDFEAQLAELTAELEAVMAELDDDSEGEEELEDVAPEGEDLDMGDVDAEVSDEDEDEDFDDITESIVDELKKVSAIKGEGLGADGKKLGGDTKSPALNTGKVDPKLGSTGKAHTDFNLEGAPKSGKLKKADNVRGKATDGTAKVTGPTKKAELSKAVPTNNKSPISGK